MLTIFLLLGWYFCTKVFRWEEIKVWQLEFKKKKKFELELIYLYFKVLRQITWKASQTSKAKSSGKRFSAWQLVL